MYKKAAWSYYWLLASLMSSVANSEEKTYIMRQTNYGVIKGYVDKIRVGKEVEKYLGVPYAQPPIGDLRFESPQPPKGWGRKILDTLKLPPACLQSFSGINYIEYHVPSFNKTSEDCLYLNVYRPREVEAGTLLPVDIFVHGGSYQQGMGAMFEGSLLALEGIIVINFNYRLGPLGFLSSANSIIPGNYGMLDQIAAFRWVKENIIHFGGDPDHITIDGHSAGGASVGLHLVSPLAKGLFHRVIQQSGSPLAHWAVKKYPDRSNLHYKLFLSTLRCLQNSTVGIKRCLKSIDPERLKRIILADLEWSSEVSPVFIPIVDGYYLPDIPEKLMRNHPVNAHQFMTGTTRDEGASAAGRLFGPLKHNHGSTEKILSLMNCFRGFLPSVGGIVGSVLEHYMPLPYDSISDNVIKQKLSEIVGDYFITAPTHLSADILQSKNVTVYIYHFSYLSALDQDRIVSHGSELFYLAGAPLVGHKNIRFDNKDRTMSRYMLRLWATFVKLGLPSLLSLKNFYIDRYTAEKPVYAQISNNEWGESHIEMTTNFKPEKMNFWNRKVPEMYRRQYRRDSLYMDGTATTPYDTRRQPYSGRGGNDLRPFPAWGLMTACIVLSVLLLIVTVLYCRTRRLVRRLIRQNSVSSGTRMINHVT